MTAVATKRSERQYFSPRNEGKDLPSTAMGTCRKLISRIGGMRIEQRSTVIRDGRAKYVFLWRCCALTKTTQKV